MPPLNTLEKKYHLISKSLSSDQKLKWALIEIEERGLKALPEIAGIFQVPVDALEKVMNEEVEMESYLLYESLPEDIKSSLSTLSQKEEKEDLLPNPLTLFEFYHDLEQQVQERTLQIAEKKQEAEQLASQMADFLSKMSHELRTPLHAILAFSEIGQKKSTDVKQSSYFEKIQKSGARLIHLIDELLELTKLESGSETFKEEPFNLKEALQEAIQEVHPLLQKKKQKLVFHYHINEEKIVGDQGKLFQIMINLLSNAIKFTPEEKRITVEVSKVFDSIPPFSYLIQVKDQGEGIPPSKLDFIFDKFSQTKATHNKIGTGLGLAIVREIVRKMNGKIWAENLDKQGACLSFTLPQTLKKDP